MIFLTTIPNLSKKMIHPLIHPTPSGEDLVIAQTVYHKAIIVLIRALSAVSKSLETGTFTLGQIPVAISVCNQILELKQVRVVLDNKLGIIILL